MPASILGVRVSCTPWGPALSLLTHTNKLREGHNRRIRRRLALITLLVIKCESCARVHSERLSSKPVFTESGQNVSGFVVQRRGWFAQGIVGRLYICGLLLGSRNNSRPLEQKKTQFTSRRSVVPQFSGRLVEFCGLAIGWQVRKFSSKCSAEDTMDTFCLSVTSLSQDMNICSWKDCLFFQTKWRTYLERWWPAPLHWDTDDWRSKGPVQKGTMFFFNMLTNDVTQIYMFLSNLCTVRYWISRWHI